MRDLVPAKEKELTELWPDFEGQEVILLKEDHLFLYPRSGSWVKSRYFCRAVTDNGTWLAWPCTEKGLRYHLYPYWTSKDIKPTPENLRWQP
jgi:hypothetical protein